MTTRRPPRPSPASLLAPLHVNPSSRGRHVVKYSRPCSPYPVLPPPDDHCSRRPPRLATTWHALCTKTLRCMHLERRAEGVAMSPHSAPSRPPLPEGSADIFDITAIDCLDAWNGRHFDQRWAIYCGSAINVLEQMPDAVVDCVVTSPPYFWLRDYRVEGQIGLEDTVDKYVQALTDVMRQVRRILTPTGVLFLNIGDTFYSGKGESQGQDGKSKKRRFGLRAVDRSGGLGIGLRRKSLIGIPWRVALQLVSDGWVLRSSVIWHRKNRLPEHVRDRPTRSYEYIFILAKNRRYYFNKQALVSRKIEEDMWTIPAQPRVTGGLDTAPFPDALVERCLAIGCPENGIVLDPFVGSGTTVRVSLPSGRSAVGIDLNLDFCTYAAESLPSI